MAKSTPTILCGGFTLSESPRWHDGALWFVDMYGGRVFRFDEASSSPITIAEIPDDDPGGIGFLPGGELVVALKNQRKVVSVVDGARSEYADLASKFPGDHLNDLVVDPRSGRSYVDHKFKSPGMESGVDVGDGLVLIESDGAMRVVVEGLIGPNGLALSPDGRLLYVAEMRACRIAEFDVDDDGSLHNYRIFATLGSSIPDGICLDEEGAVWVACLKDGRFDRVLSNGAIEQSIAVGDRWAVACALGGPDRRQLFMCTCRTTAALLKAKQGEAFLEVATVDVPGAGVP